MQEQLAVIIPVKDEVQTLEELIDRISAALTPRNISHSIIIIDDDSSDGSWELVEKLSKRPNVQAYKKVGFPGKAYSIIEGATHTDAEVLAFIDADLQYPPEVLPEMYERIKKDGLVIGKRQYSNVSKVREMVSKFGRYLIGQCLYGVPFDIQSGLKVFRREIFEYLNTSELKPWTLDLPLVLTAQELGLSVSEIDIEFKERVAGESKIDLFGSTWEIASHAVKYRIRGIEPLRMRSHKKMLNAGLVYKKRRYVTHTSLDHRSSAVTTLNTTQKYALLSSIALLLISGVLFPYKTALYLVGFLSLVYFVDVLFNFFLILRSLYLPPEIEIADEETKKVKDLSLPIYTILCPLYKEAHVLPQFVESISKLDWPSNKLDVQLLLEADDLETISAAQSMKLPSYIRVVVVPDSQPKTKPKACNYGLIQAKGEYLVIYDAEDKPDPLQLKKVYVAFQQVAPYIKCIQAKLNYYNPNQNLLTRLFTAEYSLWFDIILTGLQTIETTIPLGGTSNHFRTEELRELQGWDPFNVTEDCDLGIRLFKRGARTAVINSVTLEEANSSWTNWIRQRSRWIKGYIQTYLVHMRSPLTFLREHGWHALFFQLSIGGKIAFLFINPLMWLLTLSYFFAYSIVGPTIESLYPAVIFYIAVFSLVFGNFMFLYYYMIGVAKRQQWSLMKFVFLIPFYWLLTSVAACMGLYQLIVKPHYWEKTIHGLHLKEKQLVKKIEKKTTAALPEVVVGTVQGRTAVYSSSFFNRMKRLITSKRAYLGGALLIVSAMVANVFNFIFNMYLARTLSLEDFGLVSVSGNLLFLVMIPLTAIGTTINYQSGLLFGRFGELKTFSFWHFFNRRLAILGVVLGVVWLLLTTLFMDFFHTSQWLPFVIFSVVWVFGLLGSLDKGYLLGKLLFGVLAIVAFVEAVVKLISAIVLVELGLDHWVYLSIPLSIVSSFVIGRYVIFVREKKLFKQLDLSKHFSFAKKFFLVSMISSISTMSFLSLDILLVKHVLPPTEAGQYALISLVGKIIFFMSTLASQFVLPLVSHNEGAQKDSRKTLDYTLAATAVLAGVSFIGLGVLADWTLPLVFGERIVGLTQYALLFTAGMMCFSLSRVFMTYYLAKKVYLFSVVSFMFSIVQVVALLIWNDSLLMVVEVMSAIGLATLVGMFVMHLLVDKVAGFENNLLAFWELFSNKYLAHHSVDSKNLNILIFNWRDTRHVWAGGAEAYIHNLAKELVAKGHQVTVFCGNDGHHSVNDVVEGVRVIRRGGFYTVYIWAVIYYCLKLRGKFDVVIDSENGVPFFTPLFVGVPKFLLIHHIHQQVFREHLPFPFSHIAMFIESKMMPLVYQNVKVLTVSESSKKEIYQIGLSRKKDVTVINPGIESNLFKPAKKTSYPSIVFIGRLKPYKNVDVALKAFEKVVQKLPKARFVIAGDGEMLSTLKRMSTKMGLNDNVEFVGKVSDELKAELFAKSWVAVQPSMIEGWGITVIEANASGTPVVAANVPGLIDSVVNKKTGYLVTPKHVDELAEMLLKLLRDTRTRSRVSNYALDWAEQFTWEKATKRLLDEISESDHKGNLVRSSVALVLQSGKEI